MHDRDLELIARLAEGSLEDESEARALIASSDEHRLEYEAQLMAIEALASVGPVHMSDAEKAALHRDVWTELRAGTGAETRTPWYYRFVPVAASLFVVVGIGAVVVQNGGESSDGPATLVAAEEGVTTTAADAGSEELAGDSGEDGAALAPFASADVFSKLADEVRTGRISTTNQDGSEADSDLQSCVDGAGLDGYELVGPVPTPPEIAADLNLTLVVAALNGDASRGPLAFIDADACELVYLDE